jgi:spore germination protein GerM
MSKLVKASFILLAAVALGVAGWFVLKSAPPQPLPPVPSLPADKVAVGGVEVTLYFADADSGLLVPVRRHLEGFTVDAQTVLNELLSGPKAGEKGESPLPKRTKVLGSTLSGGIITINLNRAFQTDFPSSSAATLVTVYSIVNTLTELPGIDKVAFRIEGKPISALGPLDVSKPLIRQLDMIVKQ